MSVRRTPCIACTACLAALAATGCTPRSAGDHPPPAPRGLFEDVTAAAGLAGSGQPGSGQPGSAAEPIANRYFMPASIGSGAAWWDYDQDGDLDLFLVHGARGPGFVDGEPWPGRLLRQESDGTFLDVTARAGGFPAGLGMGAAVADVDGDGDPDLYLTRYGPDVLLRNDGDGTFTDVSRAAGIHNPSWGASALFFDDELDGDLDLYVANYVDYDPAVVCTDAGGRPDYCGPAFPGVADLLYRNAGDGTFVDVSASSGIAALAAQGLGVVSADFDGDPAPDLYVANDGAPNHLWVRRPGGGFEERAAALGVALNALARPEAGMGIALGDIDGDARWDLLLTHLGGETNTLYQRAGAQFFDQTMAAGLAGTSLPYTGFGAAFVDFDLDGDLDLAVVNGRVTRGARWDGGAQGDRDAEGYWAAYAEAGQLFENDGAGRFRDISTSAGAAFTRRAVGRGLALGDYDRDGRVDLLISLAGGGARLLHNRGPSASGWLSVRVLEASGRGDSLGARVTAAVGGRRLARLVAPAAFLSSAEARVHFGLGDAASVDLLTVRWPGGGAARWAHLPAGRRIHLIRPRGRG